MSSHPLDPMVLHELKDCVKSLKSDNLRLQALVKIEHSRFACHIKDFSMALEHLLYTKKDCEVEYVIQLNESIKALSSVLDPNCDKKSSEQMMIKALSELQNLQRKVLGLSLNSFAMMPLPNKKELPSFKTEKIDFSKIKTADDFKSKCDQIKKELSTESLAIDKLLFLFQEKSKSTALTDKGAKIFRRIKDELYEQDPKKKMQTLKNVEDMIYQMINNPYENSNDVSYSEIKNMSEAGSSFQSLSDKIREMIRHDRGFSIINSTDSGGIPSPIRESESFKKLFEYRESEASSEFNSRKVKKIEFSDTMTKGKGQKKEEQEKKKAAEFTYSSLDKMIFDNTSGVESNIDVGINDLGNGSIAETVKRDDSKAKITHASRAKNEETKHDLPETEKSFDCPPELSQELKKYSLRSSIDNKFYEEVKAKEIDISNIEIPSINNSLIDYHQIKQIRGKFMYENSEIQNPDSVSHRDGSNLKPKKPEGNNEKKATKKEFETKNNDQNELDQDEIDRNSTVKKVELKEAIRKSLHEEKDPQLEPHVYRNLAKDLKLKEDIKYQSIEESVNDNKYKFDSKRSGEGKSVNYSVLSRSKSGDIKAQSNSKGEEKESINTNNAECILYSKSKVSNGSKKVVIEEIEIPLEDQQESNDNKKTEKNLATNTKRKTIPDSRSKGKQVVSQSYQPTTKMNERYSKDKIHSERTANNHVSNKFKESPENNKRKPSDYIIKKGKVHNLASNSNQSKSVSPVKHGQVSEEPESSCNVSFNKNKRDLFQERYESSSHYKSKNKPKTKSKPKQSENNDEYLNYLKQQELGQDEIPKQNYVIVPNRAKSRNDKLRESSTKRHKTPVHVDSDHKDMRVILSQDPNFKHQDRQNSRNDFIVYTSNTGGPSLQRDDLAKDLISHSQVKDYIQVGKFGKQTVSTGSKKTLEKLSEDSSQRPNDLNDFNFYTPNNNNLNNMMKGSSSGMYMINKHPMSGSAGYTRGLENNSISFRKKSKSRIDEDNNTGYSSRLKSCNYNRRPNVNKSSSFRNLKYSYRSNSNSRKHYINNEKSSSKRNQKTKSALSSYMAAYKQNITKKKPAKKKPAKKKPANPPSMNFFNNKKNSVDSVGNSISGPYLSPFFSSRDGRPSTILKHTDMPNNMHIDMNSAISLLQHNNNMVTVDSMKSKKVKKVIPLKERLAQKKTKPKKQTSRNNRNDTTSAGNRVNEAYTKERSNMAKGNNLQSNNSFGPETYFSSKLVHNKMNGHIFTEGAPSRNESHSKDY